VPSRIGAPAARIGATAAAPLVPAIQRAAGFDQMVARAAATQRQVANQFMVDLRRPAASAAVAAPAAAAQPTARGLALDGEPLLDAADRDLGALFGEATETPADEEAELFFADLSSVT
ncbi:MAG TPA: hypothetical protein VF516_06005, partial [Kofleriaceae bacterium]